MEPENHPFEKGNHLHHLPSAFMTLGSKCSFSGVHIMFLRLDPKTMKNEGCGFPWLEGIFRTSEVERRLFQWAAKHLLGRDGVASHASRRRTAKERA